MEYAILLLENALNQELRCLATANELTKGNGFHFTNKTMKAFEESRRLANDRIPDLEKAIELLTNQK